MDINVVLFVWYKCNFMFEQGKAIYKGSSEMNCSGRRVYKGNENRSPA